MSAQCLTSNQIIEIQVNKWGFDAFLDIDIFDKTVVKGAYISDEAITLKILSILK